MAEEETGVGEKVKNLVFNDKFTINLCFLIFNLFTDSDFNILTYRIKMYNEAWEMEKQGRLQV